MSRRRLKKLLIATVALPLLVWGCDRAVTSYWVGYTDLEIEFVVTDAATGAPIPNARIEIQAKERNKLAFVLATGVDGVACKECPKSMSFGNQSGLRFTNTFGVRLPWWRYRVVAEGYDPTEWAKLDTLEFQRQVQREGSHKTKLVVLLRFTKCKPHQPLNMTRPASRFSEVHCLFGRCRC